MKYKFIKKYKPSSIIKIITKSTFNSVYESGLGTSTIETSIDAPTTQVKPCYLHITNKV